MKNKFKDMMAILYSHCDIVINDTLKNKCFCKAFSAAMICGILIHFVALSNMIFNHDSVVLYWTNGDWLLSQGKWFVTPLMSYKGPVVLNYLGGIVGIAAVGCMAGIICSIFTIKKEWHARFIGAVLVAFPTITTTMLYGFCDYFCLTSLLAVVAAYFISKEKFLFNLIGIGLLTLSVASYQAYIGFAVSILVLLCMTQILDADKTICEVVRNGIKYIVCIVISLIMYYVILKVRLYTTGMELSSYKGINNMVSNLAPNKLLESAIKAYQDVLSFILKDSLGTGDRNVAILYCAVMVLNIILLILMLLKKGLYKEPLRSLLLVILAVVCFPIAVNLVGVLSGNSSFYYITVYSFVMLFLVSPILFASYVPKEDGTLAQRFISILVALSLIMPTANWFITNNQAYQKIMYHNRTIHLKTTALVAQIQSHEDFNTDIPIIFAGNVPYLYLENNSGLGTLLNGLNTGGMALYKASGMIYSSGILSTYIQCNIAPTMTFGDSEIFSQQHSGEIANMAIYPNQGSIQCIDGCIVVRLGE